MMKLPRESTCLLATPPQRQLRYAILYYFERATDTRGCNQVRQQCFEHLRIMLMYLEELVLHSINQSERNI